MKPFRERSYVTLDFVAKLKDTTYTVLDCGRIAKDNYGGTRPQFHVEFKEDKGNIKEWKPNIDSVDAWCAMHGDDSEKWAGKQGHFEITVNDNKRTILLGTPIPKKNG